MRHRPETPQPPDLPIPTEPGTGEGDGTADYEVRSTKHYE